MLEMDRRLALAGMAAAWLATGAAAQGRPPPDRRARQGAGAERQNVSEVIQPYAAVAMQLTARAVDPALGREDARARVLAHIADIEGAIRSAAIFVRQYGGHPVRLVVLPEYLFTSYPGNIGISDYAAAIAWDMDGPEYAALGALAQRLDLFLAGNAYERDPHFPGLYFQTSFCIGPDGQLVLRYRRLLSMFAPSPHDVWDAYLDRYGLDGVFPVARTAIGNLGAIASEEILYPEIARAMALRGAEIFLHSSSEIGSPQPTHKDIAKRARAFENLAYVVSANTAGIAGTAMPLASADGNSQVVDWRGRVLSQSGDGETFTAFAELDLGALRAARRTPAMTNYRARLRPELFAAAYAGAAGQAANALLDSDGSVRVPDRAHFTAAQTAVIERLAAAGAI